MKKIGIFILGLCTIILSGNFTQAKDYEYTNLDISANILIDGTINVKEDLTANFFIDKHGIIRAIPLNYSVEGQRFHSDIFDIYVSGKKFTTNKNNGNIEIKIGDANKTLIGKQDYPISYSIYGLIRNFSGMGYSELYWNLVGNDFDTNINKIKAEIYLPKTYTQLTSNDFLITIDGVHTSVNDFGGTVNWEGGNKITITYDKGLYAYQGITLAVKFPNDYFEFDHNKQSKLTGKTGNNSLNNIGNSFLIVLLAALEPICCICLFIYAFTKIGKNKISKIDTKSGALKGKFAQEFPVIVQYNPPQGLNSAEVGLLLHRGAQAKDMLSLIYKWAAQGLINISTEKTEGSIFSSSKNVVIITKNRDIPEELPIYEKDFFGILVRNEKNRIDRNTNLYNKLHLSALEKYGQDKGRLKNNNFKGLAFISTICVFFIAPFLVNHVPEFINMLLFFGPLFLGIYLYNSPNLRENEEGAKLISHILGYREFLAACDENKLRLFLQQDPLYFDKILPYAVVFGLETELLKKIAPILEEMKTHSTRNDINSIYIINNTISSIANNSVSSSSSYSSSGGFSSGSSFGGGFSSGGGGGGGGGRSW